MRVRLELIEVSSPCDLDWNAMPGDHRVRRCSACERNVYDLSRMTHDEIGELVSAEAGALCVRLTKRADGTLVTGDCAPIRLALARKAARRSIAMAVAMAGAVAAALGGVGWLLASEPLCAASTHTASVSDRLGTALADKIDPSRRDEHIIDGVMMYVE